MELKLNRMNRRRILRTVGMTAGTGLLGGCGSRSSIVEKPEGSKPVEWPYAPLTPAEVAAEAYRQFPGNGCMFGLCTGVVGALVKLVGEPYRSFPLHMMRYGEGGCGNWGSLCGALNGGAAMIGLIEQNKQQREKLVAELFSWYENTALPMFQPKKDAEETIAVPPSTAGSILCHVSLDQWRKVSECDLFGKEKVERCRRLTADTAGKTVELLNRNVQKSAVFAELAPATQACNACHGKMELRDSKGKMGCCSCHQFTKEHP